LPGTHHIAKLLLIGCGYMHRTEGAGAQGQRQITRIAAVGLDAITRFSGNQ
jgi:hypothetical protein